MRRALLQRKVVDDGLRAVVSEARHAKFGSDTLDLSNRGLTAQDLSSLCRLFRESAGEDTGSAGKTNLQRLELDANELALSNVLSVNLSNNPLSTGSADEPSDREFAELLAW